MNHVRQQAVKGDDFELFVFGDADTDAPLIEGHRHSFSLSCDRDRDNRTTMAIAIKASHGTVSVICSRPTHNKGRPTGVLAMIRSDSFIFLLSWLTD